MMTSEKLNLGVIFGGRSGEHEVSLSSARSVLDALDTNKYNIIQIGITKTGEWLVGEDVWQSFQDGNTNGLAHAALLPIPGTSTLFTMETDDKGEENLLIAASSPPKTATRAWYHLRPFAKLDVVFPVLHGTFGEDGTLQGLLEMADLAYVGAGVLGSSAGMDKGLFKDIMLANDIPVVESELILRREIEEDIKSAVLRIEALAPYPFFVKPANMGSSVGVHKCKSQEELEAGLRDAARYD
ncbi:MAG: hypothetical protein B6I38_04535, partial [Anaerolineaceae bacterium 4572_5.1]